MATIKVGGLTFEAHVTYLNYGARLESIKAFYLSNFSRAGNYVKSYLEAYSLSKGIAHPDLAPNEWETLISEKATKNTSYGVLRKIDFYSVELGIVLATITEDISKIEVQLWLE